MDSKDRKNLAKKQFGREAIKYVSSMVHSSESDLDFVREFINPQSSWHILDIATGTGHLALTLAPHVKSVIASDITKEMLDQAEEQAEYRNLDNISIEEFDVHQIPHESNSFDLVASRIAPHHFHDITKAIEEMVRVCKTGGYIFIQDTVAPEDPTAADYFNQIEVLRDPSHVRDLSPKQWIDLLQSKGTELIHYSTKPKDWPLRWWTERMSTPRENVEKIISIMEDIYDEYGDLIHIRRKIGDNSTNPLDVWSLHPNNGYFLARKN